MYMLPGGMPTPVTQLVLDVAVSVFAHEVPIVHLSVTYLFEFTPADPVHVRVYTVLYMHANRPFINWAWIVHTRT